jgi:hypothetical protein
MAITYMEPIEHEWKKGSAELLILSLLEEQPRHGYDIGKLIELRSGSVVYFHIASIPCCTGSRTAVGSRDGGSRRPIKEGDATTA